MLLAQGRASAEAASAFSAGSVLVQNTLVPMQAPCSRTCNEESSFLQLAGPSWGQMPPEWGLPPSAGLFNIGDNGKKMETRGVIGVI